MDFEDFFADGRVIRTRPDRHRARSLVQMSSRSLAAARALPADMSSIILVTAYSALRQLLEAMSLLEGYKSYSHEAYTSYLKKLGEETLAQEFDR